MGSCSGPPTRRTVPASTARRERGSRSASRSSAGRAGGCRSRRSGRGRRSRSCRAARWGGITGRIRAPYMCTRPPLVAPTHRRPFASAHFPSLCGQPERMWTDAACPRPPPRRDLAHDPARDRLDRHAQCPPRATAPLTRTHVASMVWISRIHAYSCRTSPFHRLTCDNRSPRRSRERGRPHPEPAMRSPCSLGRVPTSVTTSSASCASTYRDHGGAAHDRRPQRSRRDSA